MRIRSIIQYVSFLALLSGSLLFAVEANFSASTGSADEDATCEVTITFDGDAYGTLTYDVSGTSTATAYGSGGYADYNLASATITLTGVTSYILDLNVINDNRYEDDETIVLNLVSAGGLTIGATSTITFTIDSEDAQPSMDFAASSSSSNEGTALNIRVSVDQTGTDVGETATIDWTITDVSTDGTDHYSGTNGTLTFTEMSSYQNIYYDAQNDQLDEANETFTITLSNNVNCSLGGGSPHQHTILDNDDPPEVQFSVASNTYAESQGTVTVTVDLSTQSGKDGITVNYSIDPSSTADTDDHTLSAGILTYTNSTSESFSFNITEDDLDESDEETLVIYLSGNNESDLTIGDNGTHTITITDNDGFPTVSIDATDSGNEAVTNPSVTVTLSTLSGRDVGLSYADETVAEAGTATL